MDVHGRLSEGTNFTGWLWGKWGGFKSTIKGMAIVSSECIAENRFSIQCSSSMISFSADGNIVSMPSGLIYQIQLSFNQTSSVEILLTSTNLELDEPPSSANPLGAAILGGGAILAVAIVAPTIFKKLKHNNSKHQTPTNGSKTNQDNGMEPKKEAEKKPSWCGGQGSQAGLSPSDG